jgi:hypothetical protein
MDPAPDIDAAPAAPYGALRYVVRHQKAVTVAGTVAAALAGGWAAYRSGIPDLWVLAAAITGCAYAALRVATEVVSLVAETLMPR